MGARQNDVAYGPVSEEWADQQRGGVMPSLPQRRITWISPSPLIVSPLFLHLREFAGPQDNPSGCAVMVAKTGKRQSRCREAVRASPGGDGGIRTLGTDCSVRRF